MGKEVILILTIIKEIFIEDSSSDNSTTDSLTEPHDSRKHFICLNSRGTLRNRLLGLLLSLLLRRFSLGALLCLANPLGALPWRPNNLIITVKIRVTKAKRRMSSILTGIDQLYAWFMKNPLVLALFAMIIVRRVIPLFSKAPADVPGSRVIKIESQDDWNAMVISAKAKDEIVIVDFWATWCPPCVRSVPRYGQMSKDYPSVKFFKVDVDQVSSVSRAQGITAMPTFKIYVKGQERESIQGFNEAEIRSRLDKILK